MRPGTEPRSPGPLANTLPTKPLYAALSLGLDLPVYQNHFTRKNVHYYMDINLQIDNSNFC